MDDEKTVRSWVLPAFCMVLLWSVTLCGFLWLGAVPVLLVPAGFATLSMVVAFTEFWNYTRWQVIEREAQRSRVLSQTADAYLAEKMRELASQSPELAAEVARRIGRPDMILLPMMNGRQPQIVIAGSDVRLAFALHVLSRSTDTAMAAQREYADSTYHFDQNHEITDRAQWVQLNWLFARQAMCTRYVPGAKVNLPPQWLPPWTPTRVIQNWLLADMLEQFKPYLQVEEESNEA